MWSRTDGAIFILYLCQTLTNIPTCLPFIFTATFMDHHKGLATMCTTLKL